MFSDDDCSSALLSRVLLLLTIYPLDMMSVNSASSPWIVHIHGATQRNTFLFYFILTLANYTRALELRTEGQ